MGRTQQARIGVVTTDESIVARVGVELASSGVELIVAESPQALEASDGIEHMRVTIFDGRSVAPCEGGIGPEELMLRVRSADASMGYTWASYVYAREVLPKLVEHVGRWVPGFGTGRDAFHGILGASASVELVRAELRGVARFRDVSVMVLGETGTGKELVARALHEATFGADAPFIAINCAALPADLLESELFGHEAGAYTGARGVRTGLFEAAAGGTIFLDEIGEMELALQPKLLRVLESREFRRIGGIGSRKLDARVVSATHRDPWNGGSQTLRSDLSYRLAGFTVNLPPLRERSSDIEGLTRHFLETFNRRYGHAGVQISRGAMQLLEAHSWPGNVRELRTVVEHAAIVAASGPVTSMHVRAALQARSNASRSSLVGGMRPEPMETGAPEETVHQDLPTLERTMIRRALADNRGNISRTARQLGIPRSTLRSKLERMGAGGAPSDEGGPGGSRTRLHS